MTSAWGGAGPALRRATKPPSPRARPDHLPDVRPAAGHYLLAGIDAALHALDTPAPPGHGLAEDLRTALARTAACGDTCRVRAAADDVRLAAGLLLTGSIAEARQALHRAQVALRT